MPANNKQRNTKIAINPEFEHLQPQVVDMERMILAGLLVDRDAFAMVSDQLRAEMFYDSRHRKIFEAIMELNMHERPVDLFTVVEELKHQGTFEKIGGMAYMLEIDSTATTSANIAYHVSILNQKYMARQLISFASTIQTKAFDATYDVDELMQEAEASLFELTQKNTRQDYTQVQPVVKQAIKLLQKAAANKGGLTGIPTGYTKLDDMTSGWQASDLIILAGRPAMGKTSFALSLAKNIAVDSHIPVGFFSLEMSNVQLVNRLISNVCEIEGKKILNGQLDNQEWEQVDQNIRRLEEAPLYVDDTPGMSIFELRTKARRLVREKGVKIIMIDYLQLMNANGAKFGSRQEEVSTISRSLKGLAKELDIPVIALSQLNRSVEKRDGGNGGANDIDSKVPQLSDLRESGAIEQDADMVLFVHRPEYYRIFEGKHGEDMRGKAQIIIAKHRKGATGDVTLIFKNQYTRFQDPEPTNMRKSRQPEGEILSSRINAGSMGQGDTGSPDPFQGANFDPLDSGDIDPFADTSINDIVPY